MPPSLSDRTLFIEAIGIQESGGNYKVVNPSSGALGKYQVLPSNLASWLKQCHLSVVSPSTYLNEPVLQDALAKCKLGGYYDTYGPRGAASVWYSGQPNWRATYGNPPVYQYVDDVISIMKRLGAGDISIPAPVEPTLPAPKEKNWAGHINTTVKGINQHHNQVHGHNAAVYQLLRQNQKLHFPNVRK